ncbi:hypothetical protein TNIN_432911 [Trichonephila inaurata madagascariensis]|uniref:Uncharacterized protein n=1 Tax=Trichonephila inaurata madagascariensis TaxID=2747483 RepID=A0A8X6YIW7_9ARAC|nr:hypothetical protein TNIN_432911 [Trichonephila inaurata madagascariensis]
MFLAPLKFVALSLQMIDGLDLLAINRRSHAKKASVVNSETTSKCVAFVLKQMNMAIYDFKVTFDLFKFGFVIMGPQRNPIHLFRRV